MLQSILNVLMALEPTSHKDKGIGGGGDVNITSTEVSDKFTLLVSLGKWQWFVWLCQ